jgi:hypothetical protein
MFKSIDRAIVRHLLVLFDRQQQVSILSGVGENFSGVLYVGTNDIAPNTLFVNKLSLVILVQL